MWYPQHTMIRLDEGWKLPCELTMKETLLSFENGKFNKNKINQINKIKFKGILLGNGKTLFKPSDINKKDEFFYLNTYINTEYLQISEVFYDGFLYNFGFNPIISYDYKISKLNNEVLIKLNYVL